MNAIKQTIMLSFLLAGLLLAACTAAAPSDLKGQLESAYATQTAQANKSEALLDMVADLQATRVVQEQQFNNAQALATEVAGQSTTWQAQIVQLEAERDTQATQIAEAQAVATRLINEIAKLQGLPTPTLDASGADRVKTLYEEAQTLYEQAAWDDAAAKLSTLAQMDETYESARVQNMLYDAYYQGGLEQLEAGDVQAAEMRFDQALAVRPNDEDAQQAQEQAALYLSGLAAWENAWGEAVDRFAALYEQDEGYQDVAQRLHDARVQYAQVLETDASWCRAVDQYDAALAIAQSDAVVARRDAAIQKCDSPAEPGTYVGAFVEYEDITHITTNWAAIRGAVENASGQPRIGITVMIQAYDWSARATTDGSGRYAFDFLSNELTFTVSLVDLPSQPAEAATKFGQVARVDFTEQ